MAEPTKAEMKAELKKYLLSEGATPAQASKLVKIVFLEVEKGKKAGEVLKQMGITFREKEARPSKRVARPKKKSVTAEQYVEFLSLDTTTPISHADWLAGKARWKVSGRVVLTATGIVAEGINPELQESWTNCGLYEKDGSAVKVYPKDGLRFLKAVQYDLGRGTYTRVSEIKTR